REMKIYTLEVDGDGDKSITYFSSPQDVKGTSLLTWSHALEADEQWLFLPALKRVKRVSSSNKSGSFMGSEFAFEDLASQEVEKYTYRYLFDESCGEKTCFVSERYPAYENSGYSRQVSWIEQDTYNIIKTEYYDRGDNLLKTLTQSDYKKYLENTWRAHTMEMVNHQSGKKTILNWGEYKFRQNLNKSFFNKNRLKTLR
ncbi:MAG: outer membrane lipoprotein-sorting protein, partial [Granulosicoccus sp.]|nr:outer membrane lipoprotein-sorting protein [Granulosicoccus sp.]